MSDLFSNILDLDHAKIPQSNSEIYLNSNCLIKEYRNQATVNLFCEIKAKKVNKNKKFQETSIILEKQQTLFSQESLHNLKDSTNKEKSLDIQLNLESLKVKEILSNVDWVFTHCKTEFLQQILSLKNHHSVQVRRKVASGLARIGNNQILKDLEEWFSLESDRKTCLILKSTIIKIQNQKERENLPKNSEVLSVSEAISLVKNLIGKENYIIEGELAEVKIYSEYICFFCLKDKQDSRLDCTLVLKNAPNFPLNDGLSVRARGNFSFSKYSKLRLDVKKLELTGQGELKRQLEELRIKLDKEGFFDLSRKRKIKKIPSKILLLVSLNSAAIQDFCKILENRRGGLEVYILPIKTQGVGAEVNILNKLEQAKKLIDQYKIDTLVITRGGGSQDDLAVFNSERLVRALHGIQCPSLVAIGHEQDWTLCEMVADCRASTPSNAAELVSFSNQEILREVELIFKNLLNLQENSLLNLEKQVQEYWTLIYSQVQSKYQEYLEKTRKIEQIFYQIIEDLQKNLQKLDLFLLDYKRKIAETKAFTFQVYQNIATLVQNNYYQFQIKFETLNLKIENHDPKKNLALGYALVWQNGKLITSKQNLNRKQNLKIQFMDGTVQAYLKKLNKE